MVCWILFYSFSLKHSLVKLQKNLASSAAKEIEKTALDARKTVAVEAGKKLIEKAMNPAASKKKLENIVSKYTGNGRSIAIQDMVKKLNGSGLKHT